MAKDSENIDRIKRNYTEATLAHAEQNLGDAPGIVPPSFKLHIQEKAFNASSNNLGGNSESYQKKDKGSSDKNNGASFVQNFQSKFNTDFRDVKVQRNSQEANKLGTKAFAKGNEIHFSSGAYQPDSKEGQKVLGHELVHVMQQRQGKVNSMGEVQGHQANDDPKLEKQADHQADNASSGKQVSGELKGTRGGQIQQPVAQGFLGGVFKSAKKIAKGVGSSLKKGVNKASGFAGSLAKKGLSGLGNLKDTFSSGMKGGLGGLRKLSRKMQGNFGRFRRTGRRKIRRGLFRMGLLRRGKRYRSNRSSRRMRQRRRFYARRGRRSRRRDRRRRWRFYARRARSRRRRSYARRGRRGRRIRRRGVRVNFGRSFGRMRAYGRRGLGRVRRGFARAGRMGRMLGGRVKRGIGMAAGFVEDKLSSTIPVAISFLAKMLGIGGISGKIQGLLGKVRKKVSSAAKKTVKSSSGGGGLFGFIGKALKSVGSAVGGVVKGGLGLVKGAAGFIGGGIKSLIGSGSSLLSKVFSGVGGIASKLLGKSKGLLGGLLDRVVSGAESVTGFMGKLLSKGVDLAQGVASKGGGMIKKLFSSGKGIVKGLLQKGMNITAAVGQTVMSGLKKGAGGIIRAVGKIASDPIGGIKSLLQKVASGGGTFLNNIGGIGALFVKKAKGIIGILAQKGGGFLRGIKETGRSAFGAIKSLVTGLGGGMLEIFKGNFKSGFGKMGMGVVGGIMGTLDTIMDVTVGMLDSTFGPQGQEIDGSKIPKRHIIDEFCAHSVAYKDFGELQAGTALSEEEAEVMRKGGYDPDNIIPSQGPNGFQAVLIMPLNADSGMRPMLAMRGTADMEGAITDTDPQQVGHNQFHNNRMKIEALINMAGGKVDITGHSLGGAMAQITTAYYTSNIGRCTTFQSPGINKETAKIYTNNLKKTKAKDKPEIAHHTVRNDLVSKAGQENLPGTVYEHDLGNIDPLEAHTAWTSGTAGRRADRADYGMTDEFFNNQIGKEIYDEATITRFKSNPHIFKRALAEGVRSLVGVVRDGGVNMYKLGKKGVSKAVNFMSKVGAGIKKASGAGKQLLLKFIKASKSKKKQLFGLMSKSMKKIGGAGMSIIRSLF